ncbi:MAG: hypothetical protein CMC13_00280 [Flavobacteriaceae bacterium]|nr:hypothetical protein [Flavobacteriaceae bacterium]|tara:strand:- start:17591 stop:17839 length:249 start_codon:yes stop_codon:yes gene_type:complete
MIPVQKLTHAQKVEIAIKLRSAADFFATYYEYLPKFKMQKDCFNYLNEIHLEVFGEEKYSNYGSFRVIMHRDGKKYLKSRNK